MVRFSQLLAASFLLVLGASALRAQDDPLVRVDLKGKPSLRFGDFLRVNLIAKAQVDMEGKSPHFETDQGAFDLSRLRAGVDGEFLKDVEFQLERDFRGKLQERDSKYPWRDAWVNFKYLSNFQVKAGKFKVPFSMEALTGETDLEFIDRSRTADDLAPGRDIGAMLHGKFFGSALGYAAGVFRNDGEKSDSNIEQRGGRTVAARATAQPLRLLSLPGDWDEVELGIAAVSSEVPEGLSSLRGRTVGGAVYFPHVYIRGQRLRIGTDVNWRPGPFSVQGEFIHVSERRDGQSVRAEDLPDKVSRGWYLTGTWAITGESKESGKIEPKRNLSFSSKGFGALEVALRYEQIVFRSASSEGVAFRSPRAPNLWSGGDRVLTVGVNWYLNRYMRIQVNGVRQIIQDVERSPVSGRERLSMGIIRLQFAL